MAPSVVPGDPGEYQLVAARWGIAHPPGYGFYALLSNFFTHLMPFRTFAWRANLFSAVCGAAIVALAYGIGRTLSYGRTTSAWALSAGRSLSAGRDLSALLDYFPSLFGALVLATGIDLWQHAVHANAHIVTALLATGTLYLLLRWWRTESSSGRWLYASAFVAGLSPVQHPLLVFAFPAYVLFGLVVLADRARPADGQTHSDGRPEGAQRGASALFRLLGATIGLGLLGLTAYLYYPIRSAIGAPPIPGPADMHTWSGFFRVVTAQGLRGNLMGFSPGEVLQRLWDVRVPLRLQYTMPGLLLAVVGLVRLWRRQWQPALLLSAYLACVLFVTVNVLQDEMAYLLGPMVVVGVLIGLGIEAIIEASLGWVRMGRQMASGGRPRPHSDELRALSASTGARLVAGCVMAVSLALPIWSLVVNWQRMDLSDFRDADVWLEKVESRFVGKGQAGCVACRVGTYDNCLLLCRR